MLKSKVKLFLVISILAIFAISTFCFADNETVNNTSTNTTETPTLISPKASEEPALIAPKTSENPVVVTPTISSDVRQGDQYLAGTSLTIDYDVEGNIYVLAESVTLSSRIIGNAFICANNVTISDSAYVSNSLYIGASNITMNGTAYDLYTASNDLTFAGKVMRDVHLATSKIQFSGAIGRDAVVAFKEASFSNNASIAGNLEYSSEKEISVPSGIVAGSIKFTETKDLSINIPGLQFVLNPIFRLVCFVVVCLILGLALKRFAPNFVNKSCNFISDGPIKTFGAGLLSFITIPLLAILLCISMVASVLGVSLLLFYIILTTLSSFVFVIAINELIAKKLNFDKSYKTILLLIVTSAAGWALTLIPIAGGILAIVYGCCGLGIFVRNILSKKNKEKNIEEAI